MDKGEQAFRAEDKATGTTQDNDKMGLAPPMKARPQRVWIHSRELGCTPEGDRKSVKEGSDQSDGISVDLSGVGGRWPGAQESSLAEGGDFQIISIL